MTDATKELHITPRGTINGGADLEALFSKLAGRQIGGSIVDEFKPLTDATKELHITPRQLDTLTKALGIVSKGASAPVGKRENHQMDLNEGIAFTEKELNTEVPVTESLPLHQRENHQMDLNEGIAFTEKELNTEVPVTESLPLHQRENHQMDLNEGIAFTEKELNTEVPVTESLPLHQRENVDQGISLTQEELDEEVPVAKNIPLTALERRGGVSTDDEINFTQKELNSEVPVTKNIPLSLLESRQLGAITKFLSDATKNTKKRAEDNLNQALGPFSKIVGAIKRQVNLAPSKPTEPTHVTHNMTEGEQGVKEALQGLENGTSVLLQKKQAPAATPETWAGLREGVAQAKGGLPKILKTRADNSSDASQFLTKILGFKPSAILRRQFGQLNQLGPLAKELDLMPKNASVISQKKRQFGQLNQLGPLAKELDLMPKNASVISQKKRQGPVEDLNEIETVAKQLGLTGPPKNASATTSAPAAPSTSAPALKRQAPDQVEGLLKELDLMPKNFSAPAGNNTRHHSGASNIKRQQGDDPVFNLMEKVGLVNPKNGTAAANSTKKASPLRGLAGRADPLTGLVQELGLMPKNSSAVDNSTKAASPLKGLAGRSLPLDGLAKELGLQKASSGAAHK